MSSTKFNKIAKICELAVSITMPLSIVYTGYIIQDKITDKNLNQTLRNEIAVKLVDRRLYTYDKIKVSLNDIYCYVEQVGDWDKLSAEDIRKIRHNLNKTMYSDSAIWSPETFTLYVQYIDKIAFENGKGCTRIRTDINDERKSQTTWSPRAVHWLTDERDPFHKQIYQQLQISLSKDLLLAGEDGA